MYRLFRRGSIADLDIDNLGEEKQPPKPGYYHIKLIKYQEDTTQRGTVHKCTWQIVGTPPDLNDERGKYIYESYYEYSSVFGKQCATIGWACGIFSKEYLAQLQKKGMNLPTPDFSSWVGATCIGRVKLEKDQNDPNKFYAKFGFEYKPVDHETAKVAGVVLDAASIEASDSVPSADNSADVF